MRRLAEFLKSSPWLLPVAVVASCTCIALALLEIDRGSRGPGNQRSLVFGAGADGARETLSTIASSVITVAGVAFSVTVLVLSLASSQYSPRVLRNFISDWRSQSVLGGFLGIFAYCIVVLRTIRGEGQEQFVPRLSVFGSIVLAFFAIGLLIFFIHHIANAIRASSIIRSIYTETIGAIDNIYEEHLRGKSETLGSTQDFNPHEDPKTIVSNSTGYIMRIHFSSLVELAKKHSVTIHLEKTVGDFVENGSPLASVRCAEDLAERIRERISKEVSIGNIRTLEQDVSYGIRQLVDVALKGLSPGINDTTTAIIAVDHLGAILAQLASRQIQFEPYAENNRALVVPQNPSFEDFVRQAFSQIRQFADTNPAVLSRLLGALHAIAYHVPNRARMLIIEEQAQLILETCKCGIPPHDQGRIVKKARALITFCKSKPFDVANTKASTGDLSGSVETSA